MGRVALYGLVLALIRYVCQLYRQRRPLLEFLPPPECQSRPEST